MLVREHYPVRDRRPSPAVRPSAVVEIESRITAVIVKGAVKGVARERRTEMLYQYEQSDSTLCETTANGKDSRPGSSVDMLTSVAPFIRLLRPGVNMWKLALSLVLPALAILIAALAQLLLTTIWPGVQHIAFPGVSADSYFVVLLLVLLCFVAASWLQRNVRTLPGAVCTAVVPTAWLLLSLWANVGHAKHIAWFRPITIFMIAAAMAPLVGVAAGWGASLIRGNPPK